ncbi:MAG: restriction endonuclease subunit S [Candidatus Marinimicrobia bacterium]|nr:restriction endonuclease subunit S [Candidatus Neomarinimicrobiota bacterium]
MKDSVIPLPPLPEQHRIVSKIEELFTKLDAGVDALKQIQIQLKRYRQSVLKAAVGGRLTEDWREQHKDELEPADKLLERIQEDQKAKLGKKYKEPVPFDTTDLPYLPEGWVWVTLGQITYLITKGSSPRWQGFDYVDKGVMFIRSQNVLWGKLDISNIVFLPESFNRKEKKSILKNNDVLLNIVGASIGRAAIATEKVENANINQAVSIIRLVDGGLVNKFLLYYLLSVNAQSRIHSETVDVARANLSLKDISELCVPFPPIEEQIVIIDEVERLFSIIDESELVIKAGIMRAQSLRQYILKRAFEGKLVPQDPNDEPASELLKRIQAERNN